MWVSRLQRPKVSAMAFGGGESAAARAMNEKVAKALPKARLEGFIVQEMVHRASA